MCRCTLMVICQPHFFAFTEYITAVWSAKTQATIALLIHCPDYTRSLLTRGHSVAPHHLCNKADEPNNEGNARLETEALHQFGDRSHSSSSSSTSAFVVNVVTARLGGVVIESKIQSASPPTRAPWIITKQDLLVTASIRRYGIVETNLIKRDKLRPPLGETLDFSSGIHAQQVHPKAHQDVAYALSDLPSMHTCVLRREGRQAVLH